MREYEAVLSDQLVEHDRLQKVQYWLETTHKISDFAQALKKSYPNISHDDIEKCKVELRGANPCLLAAYYAVAIEDLYHQMAFQEVGRDLQKRVVRAAQCRVAYLQHLLANPTYPQGWEEVKESCFRDYIASGALAGGYTQIPTLRGMIK